MAVTTKKFRIFGRGNVTLRQLVVFNCELPSDPKVVISRSFRLDKKTFQEEDSNIVPGLSEATKTLHLHDIFLNDRFGLLIEISTPAGGFSFENSKTNNPHVEFVVEEGSGMEPVCYLEASPEK